MTDRPPEMSEMPVPGVTALEHTADVGIEVEAWGVDELFLRAAQGMAHLILEHELPAPSQTRRMSLTATDRPALLREWLRELLYWHETEGFTLSRATFHVLDATRLEAIVMGGPDPCGPVREIKGVTLHGLAATQRGEGWYARVIFDV